MFLLDFIEDSPLVAHNAGLPAAVGKRVLKLLAQQTTLGLVVNPTFEAEFANVAWASARVSWTSRERGLKSTLRTVRWFDPSKQD